MKTIMTGFFTQETNRYAFGVTDMAKYQQRSALFEDSAIWSFFKGAQNYLTGFAEGLKDQEDYRLVAAASLNASPGPVTAQTVWEAVKDRMLQVIRTEPELCGILLGLHGAMVTELYEDAEGALLEVLRAEVGPDMPIVITLDLHANVTRKMVDNADAIFPCDCYPHTDTFETGIRAAQCMYRTLKGEIKPAMAWKKLDMILPYMPTQEPVFKPFSQEAQSLRGHNGLLNVGICHGFFASDIYEQGVAVIAVAENDRMLAAEAAQSLGDKIFAARRSLQRTYYTPEEAVAKAMQSENAPVVLADVSDNPGSGASADATALLRTMLDMKVKNAAVAVMYDPETVKQAQQAGIGARINVRLGGKVAPEVTGGPIVCNAYVKALTDGMFRNRDKMSHGQLAKFGDCALLRIEDIDVIVCSCHYQPYDLEIYRHIGIQPQDKKILMVKSAAHFRASFSSVAKEILNVEAPAQAPQSPKMLPLSHCRRPIYPLDDI